MAPSQVPELYVRTDLLQVGELLCDRVPITFERRLEENFTALGLAVVPESSRGASADITPQAYDQRVMSDGRSVPTSTVDAHVRLYACVVDQGSTLRQQSTQYPKPWKRYSEEIQSCFRCCHAAQSSTCNAKQLSTALRVTVGRGYSRRSENYSHMADVRRKSNVQKGSHAWYAKAVPFCSANRTNKNLRGYEGYLSDKRLPSLPPAPCDSNSEGNAFL